MIGAAVAHCHPVPVDIAVEGDPHGLTRQGRPVSSLTRNQEDGVLHVDGRGRVVTRQQPDADVLRGDRSRNGPAVVVVKDLGAGPPLVHRVAERPVLAHATTVAPAPAIDHHRAVVRGRHRTRDRSAGPRDDQLLAHRQHVGVGQAVGIHDRRDGHVVAAGND